MATAMKALKRPVVIEVMQWNGTRENAAEIIDHFDAKPSFPQIMLVLDGNNDPKALCVLTKEGPTYADKYYWIAKSVLGELYPIPPEIFEKTFDVIPEDGECSVCRSTLDPGDTHCKKCGAVYIRRRGSMF